MAVLKALKRCDFGNEAGDDVDVEELASYFVEQDEFSDFVNPKKKILIAKARKGVGKSALLQWAAQQISVRHPEALVIKVRGADLIRSKFGLSDLLSTPNDYIQDWMVRICALVNRHLARDLGFAATDDEITLVETAEIEGYKSRNLIGCLIDRLDLSFKGASVKVRKLEAKSEIELLKRQSAKKERSVWIVLDDLDATYQNSDIEALNLATFFSACRYLTQDLKGVLFRVSIRTDVWPLIRRKDESLDKLKQYVSEISWFQEDFLKLLALRVGVSLRDDATVLGDANGNAKEQEQLLESIFVPTMTWGSKEVPTYKVLYTLSYERPRWAVQLCKLAQGAALRKGLERISKESIDEVWGEYGVDRIDDLVAEHKHQCSEVQELLNAFRGAERLMTKEVLFAWINSRIVSHVDAYIEGRRIREAREVAMYLFRIGFIVARSDGDDEEYEHYRFNQMSDLLSSRTNEDFDVKWEIHPCYRQALDIKKLDLSHRQRFSRLRTSRSKSKK